MKPLSPIFGKFNEALTNLEWQMQWRLKGRLPAFNEMAKIAYKSIKSSSRFYVPQSRNVIEGREYDEEFNSTIRLPFDTTVLISETVFREDNAPTWNITIAMNAETVKKNKLVDLDKCKFEDTEAYRYVVMTLVRQSAGSDGNFWLLLPMIGVVSVPLNGTGNRFVAQFIDEVKDSKEAKSIDPIEELMGNHTDINNLCVLLSLHNVSSKQVEAPVALQKKRTNNGKQPFYSYHVLTVDDEVWDRDSGRSDKEDHWFRSHFRRGHIRRLDSERRVWVRSCFVHGNVPGFVEKDYQVVQ